MPIIVTTDSTIAIAQFVLEYDSTVLRLDSVTIGDHAYDFNLLTNYSLPFAASHPNYKNVLAQIYSPHPSTGFSGENSVAIKFYFYGIGEANNSSPLRIDESPTRTFLTTVNLSDIRGPEILSINGKITLPVETQQGDIVILAQVKAHRADQVADIFHEDQFQFIQWQRGHRAFDHRGIQVATTASIDLHHWGAGGRNFVRIHLGCDIAFKADQR